MLQFNSKNVQTVKIKYVQITIRHFKCNDTIHVKQLHVKKNTFQTMSRQSKIRLNSRYSENESYNTTQTMFRQLKKTIQYMYITIYIEMFRHWKIYHNSNNDQSTDG